MFLGHVAKGFGLDFIFYFFNHTFDKEGSGGGGEKIWGVCCVRSLATP